MSNLQFNPQSDILEMSLTSNFGKTIQLNSIYVLVDIYEDILSNFLTGKVVLLDTNDLCRNLPIVGNEKFQIIFKAKEDQKPKIVKMQVYKIGTKDEKTVSSTENQNKQALTLYLCSEEAITSQKTKISRKFEAPAESIVQNVLKNILKTTKKIEVESTSSPVSIFANYWNPFKVINFACALAKGTNYDYLCYENLDGFQFRSISTLMEKSAISQWEFVHTLERIGGYQTIKEFRFDNHFDLLMNYYRGAFGNTYYKMDHVYSTIHKETGDMFKRMNEKITTLGNQLPFVQELGSSMNDIQVRYHDIEIETIRKISLSMLANNNLICKMNGTVTRQIGDMVEIAMPTKDNESIINEKFDGKWLITQIKHRLERNSDYTQNIRLCKNAMFGMKSMPKITQKKNA